MGPKAWASRLTTSRRPVVPRTSDAGSAARGFQRHAAIEVPSVGFTENNSVAESGNGVEARTHGAASPRQIRDQHRTKIICTIGPSSDSAEMLEQLARNGMSIARLNMTHGDHAWHTAVIDRIRQLNAKGYNIAIMVDTEGSEAHLKARDPVRVEAGDEVVFSVRPAPDAGSARHFQVSYEAFVDDVRAGDIVMVDGGMVIVEVSSIEGPDVAGHVLEPGKVMSRATLTLRRSKELVRGKSAMLPVVTAKDWQDIDFAVTNKVDFLAISFVRDRNVIDNVRSYVDSQLKRGGPAHRIGIVAKMEAYESIAAMPELVDASDAIMVARSDLGAQIPMEDVPAVQREIVYRCRQKGKPVFVASQLLDSMIDVPVPTRAEVADCADAVRQQADALMLSGETAAGKHPLKAVQMLAAVFTEIEEWVMTGKFGSMKYPHLAASPAGRMSEEVCNSAATLAEQLDAKAIFVYTRTGQSAGYVSRRRPDCPVVAITDSESVLRKLNARWGVLPILMPLDDHPEDNVQQTFETIADTNLLQSGDLVVVVSDILSSGDTVRSVQLRHIM